MIKLFYALVIFCLFRMSFGNFNSLVYPIRGILKTEVDISLKWNNAYMYSETVKIGKCEWEMVLWIDEDNVLTVDISNRAYDINAPGNLIASCTFRIINRIDTTKTFSKTKENVLMSQSFGNTPLKELKPLLKSKEGFVQDGKVIVECEFSILSENFPRRIFKFGEHRPTVQERDKMMEVSEYKKIEVIHSLNLKDEEISDEDWTVGPKFEIDGIPLEIAIKKDGPNLWCGVFCNKNNPSEWWRTKVSLQVRSSNGKEIIGNSRIGTLRKGNVYSAFTIDREKNIKRKKLSLQYRVTLWNKYGMEFKNSVQMTDNATILLWEPVPICKKILAYQSQYFREIFSKSPEETDFKIAAGKNELYQFFYLAHNCDIVILAFDLEKLLILLDNLKADECFRRLDIQLTKMKFRNTERVKKLVEKYPLDKMKKLYNLPSTSTIPIDMISFEEKSEFSDVSLKVETKTFYASKQILANSCGFFMTLFYGPTSNKETMEFNISNTSINSFKNLLKFVYYPSLLVFSRSNYIDLLKLSRYFDVSKLMDAIEEFLVSTDDLNYETKARIAEEYELPYLKSACDKQKLQFPQQPQIRDF